MKLLLSLKNKPDNECERLSQITLSEASAKRTQLCEKVVGDRDVVIIQRPDGENVALIAADELDSLMETVHLLRSPIPNRLQ